MSIIISVSCITVLMKKKKAEKEWLDALRLDSTMGKAHDNLSFLYYESGQNELAWLHCQKAMQYGIQISPEFIKEIRKNTSMNAIKN